MGASNMAVGFGGVDWQNRGQPLPADLLGPQDTSIRERIIRGERVSDAELIGSQYGQGLLRMIADREVKNPDGESGYFERQSRGHFVAPAYGWPGDVPASENIGRYQINKVDFLEAQRKDKSITNLSPENQDKIAFIRMRYSGLPGRDKGYRSFQKFIVQPTMANWVRLRQDLGAEWESLRRTDVAYRGRNRNKDFQAFYRITEPVAYANALQRMGLSGSSPGDFVPIAVNTPVKIENSRPVRGSAPTRNLQPANGSPFGAPFPPNNPFFAAVGSSGSVKFKKPEPKAREASRRPVSLPETGGPAGWGKAAQPVGNLYSETLPRVWDVPGTPISSDPFDIRDQTGKVNFIK